MIVAKGIKVNNLKNIDVSIPTNKLVVITGVSGSGKTSLAFDTLFAEGQRRYVESLSSYARGFLGRMNKPEVEKISGLSPAIVVEQRVMNRNPRSTVGTTTEIYEYIKLLFARIGKTYSPISNKEVKRHSVQNVVDEVLETFKNKSKILVISPLKLKAEDDLKEKLELLIQLGYVRIIIEGKIHRIEDVLEEKKLKLKEIDLLIDRLTIEKNNDEIYMRLSDSVHTAFNESDGFCDIINVEDGEVFHYSNRFEADGITFVKPSANFFSFNNPYGACKTCSGSGQIEGISEDLVITRPDLSVYDGAVNCWKGEIMKKFQKDFINKAFEKFPIHKPYNQLNEQQKDFLWNAKGKIIGINEFFKFVKSESYKIQYRVLLSRFTGRTTCPDCKGTRLRKDASYVKIAGKSIIDLMLLPVDELLEFFNNIELTEENILDPDININIGTKYISTLMNKYQCIERLGFLQSVGLGYLTLNRQSSTLSGGESQRISLATSLGSPLVGSMYILDEPTIGLHSCDTKRLINVLLKLRDVGNTVIVVEHDEEVIKAADYIVDIGPFAGQNGGEVVFSGDYDKMLKNANTLTAQFIRGERKIPLPETTKKWKDNFPFFSYTSKTVPV